MLTYRISKEKYINDLSGNGARIYGGRWNHKGSNVIYTSESRALASFEYLAHVPLSMIPNDLCIATIEINTKVTAKIISVNSLPANWKEFPAPNHLAAIGSKWIVENVSLVLQVPSVLVEDEYNILINPSHSDIKYAKIKNVKKYAFDKRILAG